MESTGRALNELIYRRNDPGVSAGPVSGLVLYVVEDVVRHKESSAKKEAGVLVLMLVLIVVLCKVLG